MAPRPASLMSCITQTSPPLGSPPAVIQMMLPYKRQFQALCFGSQLLYLPPQINNSPFCLGRWLISYAVKPPLRNE
jgi:hypothetical protein